MRISLRSLTESLRKNNKENKMSLTQLSKRKRKSWMMLGNLMIRRIYSLQCLINSKQTPRAYSPGLVGNSQVELRLPC